MIFLFEWFGLCTEDGLAALFGGSIKRPLIVDCGLLYEKLRSNRVGLMG